MSFGTRRRAPIFVFTLILNLASNLTFGVVLSPEPRGVMTARELKCEHAVNPLGVGSGSPRLGWIDGSSHRGELQTAYQILVSSSREGLRADEADLWDTGKVVSDQNSHIAYRGLPLRSGQR